MITALDQFLFKEYSVRDGRVKNLREGQLFRIDGSAGDSAGLACFIWVVTTGDQTFKLHFRNAPTDDDIVELVESMDGKIADGRIEIDLHVKNTAFIGKLAKAFRSVVGRGKRYWNPNWKWVCPKTRDSLVLFAGALRRYRALPKKSSVVPWATLQPAPDDDEEESSLFKICGVE
jgi:hypothetical protein